MSIVMDKHFFFSATLLWVLTMVPHCSTKICQSIDVRNDVSNLNKLRNCSEISGDLYIVLILNTESESDYDDYVFPELQKISGHLVLFHLNHFTSLGKMFPNLRLIRGLTLLRNYALVIYDMARIQEIGTSKLAYIGRGYVKVGKTPKLCYADTIKWNEIGPNSLAHIQLYRNDCIPCAPQCNGYCWNSDTCQVFNSDCHSECLGCTRPGSNAHCEVCKNYDNEGTCVADCPENKYILRILGKCISKEECYNRNYHTNPSTTKQEVWFTYKGECRNTCPEGTQYNEALQNCERCYSECYQSCEGAELVNTLTIEDMRGCTHINGSLSILSLKTGPERKDLFTYLKSVRYIRDYLRISRCDAVNDLEFLPNLKEIGGKNLYRNKSLLAHDNKNLKKLWDFSGNFSLHIRNGSIGFHDNDQLCLTEIERFAAKVGINYSETDVSKYSNGAYCDETIDKDLVVNITQRNSENVTITWEKRNGSEEFYYLVHYTDSLDADEMDQDVCSSPWTTVSTEKNTVQLLQLSVYQKYHFYIRTYMKNMEVRRTPIKSFETLPDDPDSPSYFSAFPVDESSVNLTWTEPFRANGILSSYLISIYKEEHDPDFLEERDYCKFPFTTEGAMEDTDSGDDSLEEELSNGRPIDHEKNVAEVYRLKEPQYTYPGKPCKPTNEELNIRLKDNMWLYLCDKHSKSMYGIDDCKNYYYEMLDNNSTDPKIKKRETLPFEGGYFSTITLPPNVTNYVATQLEPFTLYLFYIMACNQENGERKLCSSVLQTHARTKRSESADNVPKITMMKTSSNNLIITWDPPRRPNGFVVAYHVYYHDTVEKLKSQMQCIRQQDYDEYRNITLRDLVPSVYYVSIQTVSLAGPGSLSQPQQYDLRISKFKVVWLFTGILYVLLICGCLYIAYRCVKRRRSRNTTSLVTYVNPDYTTLGYQSDEWEMEREDLELEHEIGHGEFGRVFSGKIKSKELKCAIKTVNEGASEMDQIKFLSEASTMKGFTEGHHVVKLLGVVSNDFPPYVVMELMELGDLKHYLLRMHELSQTLTSNEIYRMSIEIADGLAYLTYKKYVHRDLASRNCMVGTDKTVKIGDFGMTRDIYQSDYYKKGSSKVPLPVRWMAPEALSDGVNTYDSDIWSYGIVLWEIVTLASQPYQGLTNEEVTQFVLSKGTLQRPAECPNALWDIMKRCWEWQPKRRPTCFEVVENLQGHVGKNFHLMSFYFTPVCVAFLLEGSARAQNPPALAAGGWRYDENPISEIPERGVAEDASCYVEPDFVLPSSPHAVHRIAVQAEVHELRPLQTESNNSDSEPECESQL